MEEDIKKKKKNNIALKVLWIIVVIVVIIVVSILLYEISIMSDGKLDISNKMSKAEVVELLDKGSKYNNYYTSIQQKGLFYKSRNKEEYYIKDNIVSYYSNSNLVSWSNYNTKENIYLVNNVAYVSNNSLERVKYSQNKFDYSNIVNANSSKALNDSPDYTTYYKYVGKTKYNGRDAIIIQILDKTRADINMKYIIDLNTGLIQKKIDYLNIGILMIRIDTDRNIKLDCVTDQDIAKPDISGYNINSNI